MMCCRYHGRGQHEGAMEPHNREQAILWRCRRLWRAVFEEAAIRQMSSDWTRHGLCSEAFWEQIGTWSQPILTLWWFDTTVCSCYSSLLLSSVLLELVRLFDIQLNKMFVSKSWTYHLLPNCSRKMSSPFCALVSPEQNWKLSSQN